MSRFQARLLALLLLASAAVAAPRSSAVDLGGLTPEPIPRCVGSGLVDEFDGSVCFTCSSIECECGTGTVDTPYGQGTYCKCKGDETRVCCVLVFIPGFGFTTAGDCNVCSSWNNCKLSFYEDDWGFIHWSAYCGS